MLTRQQFFLSLGNAYEDVYVSQIGDFLEEYRAQTAPVLKALVLTDILKLCAGFWKHEKATMHQVVMPVPTPVKLATPSALVTGRKRSNNVQISPPPFVQAVHKPQRSNAMKPMHLIDGSAMTATFVRKRVISDLETAAAKKLCKIFGCTPNLLPHYLEERFAVDMSDYKKADDLERISNNKAFYLKAEAVAKLKVTFRNGSAYVLECRGAEAQEVLADTSNYFDGSPEQAKRYGSNGSKNHSHRNWCYGYVFTAEGLFMTDHNNQEFLSGGPMFYHSSYMAGGSVTCAGDISFLRGKLTSISTCSGHYQPEMKMILPVLRYLKSKQVSLDDVSLVDGYDDLVFLNARTPDDMFESHDSLLEDALSLRAGDYLRQQASSLLPRSSLGSIFRKP